MEEENNKALLERFNEEVFKGNLSVVDELVAPDFIDHSVPPGMPNKGPDGVKKLLSYFISAFSDINVVYHDIIAKGDKVTGRYAMTCIHKGEFMGISATSKKVTINGIEIVRIKDRKFVERWAVEDMLGLMEQLGAMPKK
ncbi:ester cyclase [Candidatus Woesearchaeota archaeon]|nr:ester cyclase [Candidatus Woesearchaeota archaeon]